MRPFRIVRLGVVLTLLTVAAVRRYYRTHNGTTQAPIAAPQR